MAGLKFRVLLDSKDQEKVFRDILISDSDNFESFYKAIISSFRFEGDQMASFYMSNDDWDKGRRGLRLARGQQHGEGVLVPSKDQAEDGGGNDAGHGLR